MDPARARPVRLAPAPKHAGPGVHRTVPAGETWRRLRPLLDEIGVTRLADVTGLDRVGIPCWTCVRPLADRFSVTVTCGKGRRSIDARVGAVMEAVEYRSAEADPGRIVSARRGDLPGAVLDPRDLVLPSWSKELDRVKIDWVRGWDLASDEPVWLPAPAVFFPCEPREGVFLFTPNTNGLAAGNRVEEAVCHGLAETVERDAWSLVLARAGSGEAGGLYPAVDLATAPPAARALASRFRRAGVDLFVRDITSDLGIAAFHAASLEDHGGGRFLAHEGMGAHPDASVALVRALTEVAQSRVADIQGGREDLTFWRARGMKAPDRSSWLFQRPDSVPFDSVPSRPFGDCLEDVRHLVLRLRERGLHRVIAVDLTRPEIGFPVVRMVVPGLEVACVDPWRVGPRASGPVRLAAPESPRT